MRYVAESSIEQSILQALNNLRFGSVEITVHDSKIVQIERREKVRVELESARRGSLADDGTPLHRMKETNRLSDR
jgi:hypothetical protein